MPSKYGAVAKVFVEQDTQIGNWLGDRVPNPYALNLYVLAYDKNKNFVECNDIMKNNIIQFLSQYRMLTDAINIKNPYIINISIDVEIMSRPNTNSNEVILRCLDRLVEMFKPENMGINEPIIISKIRTELDRVEGVETVMSINFGNLVDTSQGYSPNVYPIENAIVNGILYPSVTPSIFSIQYPRKDIRVRIAQN
jgi:hypothetical protein